MTFIQALYGSQYFELVQKGRDGSKGRFNSNIFLAAFIFLVLVTVIALTVTISPHLSRRFNSFAEHFAGSNSGKETGMLLAIPVMAICYFFVSKTVGTQKNYFKIIDEFKLLPDDVKSKANKKILAPFFIVLIIFFGLLMSSLFINR